MDTVESGAKETFKTDSSYLPWNMRNVLLEMSCLQSKSISASVAGKTQCLLEGSKELPGILCQHLQQFSAQCAHNAHSLPTNSIQKIRRHKKWHISSNHLCSVPGRFLEQLFNHLAMLQIIFSDEHIEYYSIPVGSRKLSEWHYNRE